MTSADFVAWRKYHVLTQEAAARLLDRSVRAIRDYESGRPIPRVVAGACWAIDNGWKPEDDD